MSDPITVTAVFTPKEGRHDELVAALQRTMPAVHDEDGCVLYAIHDAPDQSIVMIEKWESVELLERHGSGAAVAALGDEVAPFLAEPTLVTRLIPIPAGDPHKGTL